MTKHTGTTERDCASQNPKLNVSRRSRVIELSQRGLGVPPSRRVNTQASEAQSASRSICRGLGGAQRPLEY
jgi:hypothetical protein